MRLIKLDSLQYSIIADDKTVAKKTERNDDSVGCWNCVYSDNNDEGLYCEHPLNNALFGDLRIPFGVESIISNYLDANNLEPFNDDSDMRHGKYCNLYFYHNFDDDKKLV